MTDGEIIPGVLSVRLRRVFVYVVLEPRLTLIDTGLPGSAPAIARALEPRGLGLGDIARAICTHGHPDHAGGAAELAAAASRCSSTRPTPRALSTGLGDAAPPPHPGTPLRGGDARAGPDHAAARRRRPPGPRRSRGDPHPGAHARAASASGPRATGSCSRATCCSGGSAACSFASSLFSDDVKAARRSVQRLASLDVKAIVFGHYPPLVEGAGDVIARLAHEASRG